MNLPTKGSMIPIKKVVGWIIGIIGISLIIGIECIKNLAFENPAILGIILVVSAYFLAIAGRRR